MSQAEQQAFMVLTMLRFVLFYLIIGCNLFFGNIAMKATKPSRKEGKGNENSQGAEVQQGAL
ncbi:MAG: hypothetical protein PVH78_06040 [Deltaproteobacteria bacterium]